MLVLSRKVGERIWIGENISVTVVRISGGGVRLGIDAPNELPVVREELRAKMAGETGIAGEIEIAGEIGIDVAETTDDSPSTIKFRSTK